MVPVFLGSARKFKLVFYVRFGAGAPPWELIHWAAVLIPFSEFVPSTLKVPVSEIENPTVIVPTWVIDFPSPTVALTMLAGLPSDGDAFAFSRCASAREAGYAHADPW